MNEWQELLIQPFIFGGLLSILRIHKWFLEGNWPYGLKVLFKRDLLSNMRMRLESGRERCVRDNQNITVFMISNALVVSLFFQVRGGNVGEH